MLTSRFPRIILMSQSKVAAAVRRAERGIERRAKSRSRVDTGNMRGAWEHEAISPMEGIVFNTTHYAIYHEFGTVNMSAQPMLRPAIEETREEFERDVRGAYV